MRDQNFDKKTEPTKLFKAQMLNITNGDVTVNLLKESRYPAEAPPWRDVLLDGPIRANLSLNEMSEVRANFISDSGWEDASKY